MPTLCRSVDLENKSTQINWVEDMKHLGNTEQSDNTMTKDMTIKRGGFIWKVFFFNQEFHFCNPDIVLNFYKIYACSFYSSSLYDIFVSKLDQLYRTWNKTFSVTRDTHTYMVQVQVTSSKGDAQFQIANFS